MWGGNVVSIHVATGASAPMQSITEVRAFPGRGLNAEGERFGIKLAAADTRRNITTSSVPLNHLVDSDTGRW
jgi:hypothetical protein